MRRLLYITYFWAAIIFSGKAQDPQFSQYYAIPTYLGPSFAGTIEGERYVANYRDQWPGVSKTYKTYSLAWDKNLQEYKSGVGAIIIRDQLSPSLAKTLIGAQYSYHFFFRRQRIHVRPGLTFHYYNINYDKSNIILGHQLEGREETLPPQNMPPIKQVHKFDMNTSVFAYNENFWAGLSVDHLTRTNESLTNTKTVTPMKYTIFGGYKYDLGRRIFGSKKEKSVTATFLYNIQGTFDQLDIGVYHTSEPLTYGLWYRGVPFEKNPADKIDHDALVFLIGYQYDRFRLSYSYDISISSIFLLSKGTHEVTLTYELPYKDPRKKIKAIPCPKF